MSDQLISKKEGFPLLGGALLLGLLSDYFFYGKSWGISYPLFVGCVYALFFAQFRRQVSFRYDFAWFLTIPIALLSLTFLFSANLFFHLLAFLAVPLLFLVQTILLTSNNQREWHTPGFLVDLLDIGLVRTIASLGWPIAACKDWLKANTDKQKYGVAVKVMAGLLISLPLLLLVISLLSKADVVFEQFVSEIPRQMASSLSGETLLRTILVLIVAGGLFAYLWALHHPRTAAANPDPATESIQPVRIVWDGIIAVTVLTIINVVYLLFTWIQISYLFSGTETVLPDGMTYAAYARKGFGELVMVTVINFFLLLSFMHLTAREKRSVYQMVQILLSLLTTCTGVLLFSAYFRLSLYEEAYGYTHARLFAHAFMLFLSVLFVIALVKIWREGTSLIKCYVVAGLVAYLLLNYANIDGMIAKNNIDRYLHSGRIDTDYLSSLSYDAVPELLRLVSANRLDDTLRERLKEMREELRNDNGYWQSFNLSTYRAKRLLLPES